jgi:hypothetical protein
MLGLQLRVVHAGTELDFSTVLCRCHEADEGLDPVLTEERPKDIVLVDAVRSSGARLVVIEDRNLVAAERSIFSADDEQREGPSKGKGCGCEIASIPPPRLNLDQFILRVVATNGTASISGGRLSTGGAWNVSAARSRQCSAGKWTRPGKRVRQGYPCRRDGTGRAVPETSGITLRIESRSAASHRQPAPAKGVIPGCGQVIGATSALDHRYQSWLLYGFAEVHKEEEQ